MIYELTLRKSEALMLIQITLEEGENDDSSEESTLTE